MDNDQTQAIVIGLSVVGGVAIVGGIAAVTVCIAYCKEKLFDRCQNDIEEDAESERSQRRHHHHHRRRRRRERRRRRRDLLQEETGHDDAQPAADVQLENPELAAHRPPPSYDRVHQYSSLEGDLHLVTATVENGVTETRVSMYIGDDETALSGTPTNAPADEKGERGAENAAASGGTAPAPQQDTLPPTYSMAQLETRTAATTGREGEEEGGQTGGEHAERHVGGTLESVVENVEPGEGEGDERSLPPSYSIAKLELAKRSGAGEQTASATNS